MRNVTVRALFCPHESYRDRPEPAGPPAAGVKLTLTDTETGREDSYTTDGHGTVAVDVQPGKTYSLGKADTSDGYAADGCTIDDRSGDECEIRVYPVDQKWRLDLHLRHQTPTGVRPLQADQVYINSAVHRSDAHGTVYALVPPDGRIEIDDVVVGGVALVPQQRAYRVALSGSGPRGPMPIQILFQEPATVRIAARLHHPDGSTEPLPGLSFTLTDGSGGPPTLGVSTLGRPDCVARVRAGTYRVAALPFSVRGYPIAPLAPLEDVVVGPGGEVVRTATFVVLDARLVASVTSADGTPLASVPVTFTQGAETVRLYTDAEGLAGLPTRSGAVWTVSLPPQWTDADGTAHVPAGAAAQAAAMSSGEVRTLRFGGQADPGTGVRGQVVDRQGRPQAGVVVDVFDAAQNPVGSAATDADGRYEVVTPASGRFYVALRRSGDRLEQRTPVEVHSWSESLVMIVEPDAREGRRDDQEPVGGSNRERRESIVDLTAYPVMTEDVSTRGGTGWGAAPPSAGRGEGAAVEQVVRDVLGWRPRADDVSGFQAALTGAFQLSEVEGHTAWKWQSRGYAVQADMGAVTGAQASIYARARNALDQLLPLLDGLTPLNPAVDLIDAEATRSIVRTEVTELVYELGNEGGPRLQRVDDLFLQLIGRRTPPTDPNDVEGQLGELADRFGLTADRVNTLDEERVVTNYRIVVEHVLALAASWRADRKLFDPGKPSEFLGISLIRLSRSLEAIADATDDLVFALDSVFIGPGERQVIEVRSGSGPVILLSDLLDWIRKAVTVEGRQLIQDAGKDGVAAFAPVLARLTNLVTAALALDGVQGKVPPGFHTPRVRRALSELADQLAVAAGVAGGIQRQTAPTIAAVLPIAGASGKHQDIVIFGTDFRPHAQLELSTPGRRAEPLLPVKCQSSSAGTAQVPTGVLWAVRLVNEDGTRSNSVDLDLTTPNGH